MFSATYGQTQLVVTSVLQTERTFQKGDELFLETKTTRNELVFTLDSITKKIAARKYLVETFYSLWDGVNTIKRRSKQRYRKWKHEISKPNWERLLCSLKTNNDTLKMNLTTLHTSHHYLNFYIDIITENDTVSYWKTKPFAYSTPWNCPKFGFILNPLIDIQIAEHLPLKFIGREKLIMQSAQPVASTKKQKQ